MKLNRVKLKKSLALINVAVFVAAVGFLPRKTGGSYFWTNEFERFIKRYTHNLPYAQILLVCGIALLVTFAIYFWIDAFCGEDRESGTNASEQAIQPKQG